MPRTFRAHGHTRAGRLCRVDVETPDEAGSAERTGPSTLPSFQSFTLPALIYRPEHASAGDHLQVVVSGRTLHLPRRIWTASAANVHQLAVGETDEQAMWHVTATYGDLWLSSKTWENVSADRYYMIAWEK